MGLKAPAPSAGVDTPVWLLVMGKAPIVIRAGNMLRKTQL
jgi:hypothetical protein